MSNLGWLFYKDYFNGIHYRNLESEHNENYLKNKIVELIDKTIDIKEPLTLGNSHIQATTTYPGLLLGSGYNHELPDTKGQAILGFDFDYTTGLPIIRGSSVKGLLRSAFEHQDYIQEILGLDIDVKKLEEEIFEEQKDIFFDAEIVNAGSKILEDDYITPHKDALKNPIPLRFIKVAPNVTFRFDFYLTDGLITKEQKLKLFMQILEDLGIGAKTNVGYGKLKDIKKFETKEEKEQKLKEEKEKLFKKLLNSEDIEELKREVSNLKDQEQKDKINQKIKKLEHQEKINEVVEKWEKLKKDKNKKFIKSFYDKKENRELLPPNILEEIEIILGIKKIDSGIGFNELNSKNKLSAIQKLIKGKNINLSEEEKEKLYNKIINKDNIKLDIKSKKFAWNDFKKLLGDDRGQAIGDMLK